MQKIGTAYDTTEEFFESIPFDLVYHDGAAGFSDTVKFHRCAEVLLASPTPIKRSLRAIYCRSPAERESLLHALGGGGTDWAPLMVVSDDLGVFIKEYTFVEEVRVAPEGLVFRLHPRRDGAFIHVRIQVWSPDGHLQIDETYADLAAKPPNAASWRTNAGLAFGQYIARIELEGQLAFESKLALGDALF
jgi:hypothetical protein